MPEFTEQTVHIKIDNSSVFVPGGNPANAQYGFRRTEIIAENNVTLEETNTTVFHFSIAKDDLFPLNVDHEYQIVFIEPNDGSESISTLRSYFETNLFPQRMCSRSVMVWLLSLSSASHLATETLLQRFKLCRPQASEPSD